MDPARDKLELYMPRIVNRRRARASERARANPTRPTVIDKWRGAGGEARTDENEIYSGEKLPTSEPPGRNLLSQFS